MNTLRAFQFSAFFQMFFMSSSSLLPLFWSEHWHYSSAQIAWLNSISLGISLFSPLFFGSLRRISGHLAIALLFSLTTLSSILLWLNGAPEFQILLFALLQFARAGIITLVPAGVLHFLGPNSGEQYGAYRRVGSLGFLAGVIGTGYLSDHLSTSVIPASILISALLASLPFWQKIRIPAQSKQQSSYLQLLKHPIISPLLTSYAFISAWSAAAFTLMPLRLKELGASASLIGWTISLCGITALLTLLPIGKWLDRQNPSHYYLWVPLFSALRIALMALPSQNPTWFLAIQLLHIPTWVLGEAIQMKLIRSHCPSPLYAQAMALMSIALSLGVAISSAIAALIQPFWGLQGSFWAISTIPLVAIPYVIQMQRKISLSTSPK